MRHTRAVGHVNKKARVEGATAHAVVAGTVGAADDNRELRHAHVRLHHDHLGAVLGNAARLILAADHIAGDVLQEDQRRLRAVAVVDEMRRLQGAVVEQHAVVAEDADLVAPEPRKSADQRRAVVGLELVEAAPVHQTRDQLADVILDAVGRWHDAVDLLRVVVGFLRLDVVDVFFLRGREVGGDDLTGKRNRLLLRLGRIVRRAGDAGMHVDAAQLLGGDLFAQSQPSPAAGRPGRCRRCRA